MPDAGAWPVVIVVALAGVLLWFNYWAGKEE